MIKPWSKISSKTLGDYRIFKVRGEQKVSPRTGKEHDVYVIESVNWVNVVPVTADNQLVMIEQYRHGSNTIELEIPGGMMDDTDESPEATGARELREETGYEGEQAQVVGAVYPNPAIMSNTCYFVLIRNCRPNHPTAFDHGEDLHTRLIPLSEVPRLVASGEIRHALVVAALYHFELWQRQLK